MYKVKNIRGTVFCAPIKYSKEFVVGLSEFLNDYMPVLLHDSSLPFVSAWQLTSPDNKETLLFSAEKIDIIRIIGDSVDNDAIAEFVNHCKLVFGKIMEFTGYACTRVALAPTVFVTENGERPDALYDRLFGIHDFQHTTPAISNVSQVFRVKKNIGGKDVIINHVANFHAENEVINVNGRNQLVETYQCDFDINTLPDPNYRFTVDEVKEFFDLSTTCFEDYYNLYFAE